MCKAAFRSQGSVRKIKPYGKLSGIFQFFQGRHTATTILDILVLNSLGTQIRRACLEKHMNIMRNRTYKKEPNRISRGGKRNTNSEMKTFRINEKSNNCRREV